LAGWAVLAFRAEHAKMQECIAEQEVRTEGRQAGW
jgi:hypothetical protein